MNNKQLVQAGFTARFVDFIAKLLETVAAKRATFMGQIWAHPFLDPESIGFWRETTLKREIFTGSSISSEAEENPYVFEIRDLIKLQSDELVDQEDDDELTDEQQKLFEDF